VIAFGFGSAPKYLVTAIIVFFPFLVNALAGLRDVDDQALDVMTTLHASRWQVFYRLRLPSSLPFLFAGARICLPLAVVGAVVAEISAAGQLAGLGSLIQISAQQADLRTIWASILVLAVMGVLFTIIVSLAQSRILWWTRTDRRPQ
jgi:NitT/TauT family transport system permease protein